MKKFVYVIILVWLVITGALVFYNESFYISGKEIILKVKPLDPRDFLRGDYISLDYDINVIPERMNENSRYSHAKVYAVLKKNPDDTYDIMNISTKKPANDVIFLRGQKYAGRIYYDGIQQYFVKEGEAKVLEKKLQNGGLAKISIGSNGRARIKDIIENK